MKGRLLDLFKNKYEYLVVALIAVAFFIALYGVRVLDVTYTDFLLGNYEIKESTFGGMDQTQHYYGWEAYRRSDWRFPIGCFDSFSYPSVNCIIFTDSIPLLAILFKIFAFCLPESFQYFGLWGLLTFVLNGILATRILSRFTKDKLYLVISSALFITLPILVWRMFMHTALDSQWLMLLALEPIFAYEEFDFKRVNKRIILVALLASLIHIYLLYFCGIILAGYCLYDLQKGKKLKRVFILLIEYIATAGLMIALVGGFSVSNTGDAVGLNSCSMNINSFFNSEGFSLLFGELSQYEGQEFLKTMQFEGYAYWGLGVFFMILVTCLLIFTKKIILDKSKSALIIVLACIFAVSFIIALSPTITLGDEVLFKVPIPTFIYSIWSIFRSTGRVIWIAIYVLVLSLCILISRLNRRLSMVIICAAVLLQLGDNYPLYNAAHKFFYGDIVPVYSEEYCFSDRAFWESAANTEAIKHVVIGITADPYNDETWSSINDTFYIGVYPQTLQLTQFIMADFALENDMTLNYYLFARSRYDLGRQYIFDLLDSNESLDEYLFIFFEENKMQAVAAGLNVYYADGYYIGYAGELNSDYLIEKNDINYYASFVNSDMDYHYGLDAGTSVLYSCVELAKGEYVLYVSSDDNAAIVPSIGSAYMGYSYSCEFMGADEDCAYYSFKVDESDSTVCFTLSNISNDYVSLNYTNLVMR